MRSTILRLAAAACVAGAALVAPLSVALAQEEVVEEQTTSATLLQYGWWNKAQQGPNASTAVPPPPNAPEDGLYLAYEPAASNIPPVVTGAPGLVAVAPVPVPAPPRVAGPEAYSAVRYSVPEGAEGDLVLRFLPTSNMQPGGVNLDGGGVKACPALSPWDPVQNARYDIAPAYDCASFAVGNMLGDTIVFTLPATLANEPGLFDLVIVPDPLSPQPFQFGIAAPSDASLILTSVPETATEEAFDPSASDPLADFAVDTGESGVEDFFVTDAAASDFFADGSFATGPVPAAANRRPQLAVPAGNPLNPFRPDASRGERLVAVAVLLLMGAGLLWLGGQPTRAPRLLGSLGAGAASAPAAAATRTGGIGRFSRPRGAGKPPRLF